MGDELLYLIVVPFWYYWWMPPKVRILIKALRAAGFELRRTRGNHRRFIHPGGAQLTVSGKDSSDARPYQVQEVRDAIAKVQDEEK